MVLFVISSWASRLRNSKYAVARSSIKEARVALCAHSLSSSSARAASVCRRYSPQKSRFHEADALNPPPLKELVDPPLLFSRMRVLKVAEGRCSCHQQQHSVCAWASRTRFAATFKSRLFDSASAMSFFSTESVKILCQLWSPIEAPDEELLDTSGAIAAR